jgi:hypothetical protein
MNVRLIYEMAFGAGLWYNSTFYVNNYTVKINLVTNTTDGAEHNLALARIKYFVYEILEGAVFINAKNLDQRKKLEAAGLRVIALPEEPVDQILGMALTCKFNAIMQARMIVTDLDISSEHGDNIVYCHNAQEAIGPLEVTGWWHDAEPVYSSHTVNRNQRVIAINRVPKWHDLDLAWEPQESDDNQSDIVVTSFKREDK